MTKTMLTAAQSFLLRFDGLKNRLPGCAPERQQAADILAAKGFPSPREEAWKYTNLSALSTLSFQEALTEISNGSDDYEARISAMLPELDAPRLVFVDGRFAAELSQTPDAVQFSTFADVPHFSANPSPERQRLVALNTMLAEDGARITVPAGTDAGTILLASVCLDRAGRRIAVHPRHAITVQAGASLTIVDVCAGEGTYLNNPVTDVTVEPGATLTHIRLQQEATDAFHCSTIYASVAEGGTYDSFLLTLGSALARAEIHATLAGPNATAHLNGAQLLGGQQHADFTTVVSHKAPHCASNQTVKNVLADRSRAVFQGKIEVDRVAQKTDGYQMNQTLLLSRDAEINAKPELEIFADDVKCSHGATVGELDRDQLFCLRSRGIKEADARSMLVRAFLSEALDPIADDDIRALLDQAIDAWWEKRAA